jgi:hypothetical protein
MDDWPEQRSGIEYHKQPFIGSSFKLYTNKCPMTIPAVLKITSNAKDSRSGSQTWSDSTIRLRVSTRNQK